MKVSSKIRRDFKLFGNFDVNNFVEFVKKKGARMKLLPSQALFEFM